MPKLIRKSKAFEQSKLLSDIPVDPGQRPVLIQWTAKHLLVDEWLVVVPSDWQYPDPHQGRAAQVQPTQSHTAHCFQ
jgi:hypothetical protein